jgi:hypothetical protein
MWSVMLAFVNTRYAHTFRGRKPIRWRKGNAPSVPWDFQLQGDLEKLSHSAWTLDPSHSSANSSGSLPGFGVRDFESDPHIFQNVVLRLVAAAVAIDDQRRGAFREGASECINTRNRQRNRLHDPRAASLALFLVLVCHRFRHHFRCFVGKIAALFIHPHRRRS